MQSVCDSQMAAAMAAVLASRNRGGRLPVSETKAQQMHMYLNKLKDLVPSCPKNRQVTKLEVIQHVIDYINDLQDTLQSDGDSDPETPPESPMDHRSFDDAFAMEDDPQEKEHCKYDSSQFSMQEHRYHGYGDQPQYLHHHQQQQQHIDDFGYSTTSFSSGSTSYGATQRGFDNAYDSSHPNSFF